MSSHSEFRDSENKIEENKMMREGMGRGPHTLEHDRGTRCQTDAGVRHHRADCTLAIRRVLRGFQTFSASAPFFQTKSYQKSQSAKQTKGGKEKGRREGAALTVKHMKEALRKVL